MQVAMMTSQAVPSECRVTTSAESAQLYHRSSPNRSLFNGSSIHGQSPGSLYQIDNSRHSQRSHNMQHRSPESPPSPPSDEAGKLSLPSISSLLNVAVSDAAPASIGHAKAERPSPRRPENIRILPPTAFLSRSRSSTNETSYGYSHDVATPPSVTLPPTPPLRPDSVDVSVPSPSAASVRSSFSGYRIPLHLNGPLKTFEPHLHRQVSPPLGNTQSTGVNDSFAVKRDSFSNGHVGQYATSSFSDSPYRSSPEAASVRSGYSPDPPPYISQGMQAQQPLPSSFPPPHPPIQLPLPVSGYDSGSMIRPTSAPHSLYELPPHAHQHHHYIAASSAGALHQSQDRYICPTCQKAFSRPSSLRIHSHSHTGEKPFRCPHVGCGKAFSVRSNMKRHERGCHAGHASGILM